MISVEAQFSRAQEFLASIPGAAERATARALNRAAIIGRGAAVSAIDARYAVQPSDVRAKISVRSATPGQLAVSVIAKSPSLALGYFPHSPTERGTGGRGRAQLRAEVLRGQAKSIPGAFIAPINGKNRVMIRLDGVTRTGKTKIKSVYGVPIAVMLGAESVREAVELRTVAAFDDQLDREIDRELGRGE